MQAIILASGYNTRVNHLCPGLPKALFPVNGRPFLFLYLQTLFKEGIYDVIIITYYQADKIKAFINNFKTPRGSSVTVVERRQDYGPVGALCDIEELLEDNFFLFYVDVLFDINLKKALTEHKKNGLPACALITQDEFGMFSDRELLIDKKNHIVTKFKPHSFLKTNGWVDVGQIYNRSIVESLKKCPPAEEHINLNIWPKLIAKKRLGYFKVGPVLDIGTEVSYKLTSEIVKKNAKFSVFTSK